MSEDEAIDAVVLTDVAARLRAVQDRVLRACVRAGRDPAEVTIVGACKRQPLDRIAAALLAGLRELGENYVQEARDKQTALAERLARGPAYAYARTKALLRGALSSNLETQLQREQESFIDCSTTPDFAEGVAAFVEKREAKFGGS